LSAGIAGTVDFHGVPISLDYAPFDGDAFRSLFASFERRGPSAEGVHIDLNMLPRADAALVSSGWDATFCHGVVQGYSRDGEHLLEAFESRIEVKPRLGSMVGRLVEGTPPELIRGMQHIALALLLREASIFDLHAATACTNERGLVVVGDSGSGKTTLLLALLEAGLNYLGDDRLLFRTTPETVELLGYPREFHLSRTSARLVSKRLPDAPSELSAQGKYSLDPRAIWPGRFVKAFIGQVVLLLPRIVARPTSRVQRANGAEAFGRLLSSSASVVVEALDYREQQLNALKLLANTTRAFELELGTDLLARPAETARLLLTEIDASPS
jgi:hypothetical protein